MTLPTTIQDREFQKFEETQNGLTSVRVSTVGAKDKVLFESNTIVTNGSSVFTGVLDLEGYRYLYYEIEADQDGVFYNRWYDDNLKTRELREFSLDYMATSNLISEGTTSLTRYLEVEFQNNSGADQAEFFFRIIASNNPPASPLVRSDTDLPEKARAQLVRSILAGRDTNGQLRNVSVNNFGAINTSSFLLDVSQGLIANVTSFVKTGRNPVVNTSSTPEDIWHGGGLYTGQPAWGVTPETVEVFSSDANDTSAGTGARTVRLYGLDGNGDRIQADVTLNGTTPVLIPALTWARLNYAEVLTVGSNSFNIGNITARATTTTTRVFMVMPAGVNKTATGASTVPRGRSRSIYSSTCRIARLSGAAGSANVRFLFREPGGVWITKINEEVTTDSPFLLPTDVYIELPELTDFKWQVTTVSDNATIATCSIPWLEFAL